MRIVFICTTNVWGSAMAELMARSLLSERDPDRQMVQVYSAGVRAQIGAPMSASAQQVLAERGLDGSVHRARWMSPEVLAAADLTLTMGEVQRDAALALNPRGLRSTFTLHEASGLLTTLAVSAHLAPDPDRHARALVAEMAGARRYRKVATASDDIPDLVVDAVGSVRALADRVELGVRTVFESVLLPEFAAMRSTGRAQTAATGAVA